MGDCLVTEAWLKEVRSNQWLLEAEEGVLMRRTNHWMKFKDKIQERNTTGQKDENKRAGLKLFVSRQEFFSFYCFLWLK